jgi:hypothetical protein
VARLTLQLLPLSIRERMRMTPKVLTEARVGPSTSRRPLTFQVSANDDAGDGNGHCGVTNAQAKRHATEERDRPFGLRPRHVRERTATRRVLAGVIESNTSSDGGHDGSELHPNGRTGDRWQLPKLAEAVSSRCAGSAYVADKRMHSNSLLGRCVSLLTAEFPANRTGSFSPGGHLAL